MFRSSWFSRTYIVWKTGYIRKGCSHITWRNSISMENECNSQCFKILGTGNYSYWYGSPTNIRPWWCRKSASHVYRRFYLFRFIFQPAGLEVRLHFVPCVTEDIPSARIVSQFFVERDSSSWSSILLKISRYTCAWRISIALDKPFDKTSWNHVLLRNISPNPNKDVKFGISSFFIKIIILLF